MKFGERYVWLLMKNTICNGYGTQVVRIGPTSISIVEAEKPFAAYTLEIIVLVS